MACNLATTLAAACTSGIGKLRSKIKLLRVWAQLLCDGAAPQKLILDDGVNPPTVIDNPTGAYNYTGEAWISVRAINATGITSLTLGNNPALQSLAISGMPTLPVLTLGNTSLVTLDLSEQTEANNLSITGNTQLVSIDLSSLHHTNGQLTIAANAVLTSLQLTSLVYVSADLSIYLNASLPSLNLPSLENFSGSMDLTTNPALVSVSMPALLGSSSGAVGLQLNAQDSSGLTTFVIPAIWPFVDGFEVIMTGLSLNQAAVDLIINSAFASAPPITTTLIQIDGGSSAALSGTPLANALALTAAGNTLTYNI